MGHSMVGSAWRQIWLNWLNKGAPGLREASLLFREASATASRDHTELACPDTLESKLRISGERQTEGGCPASATAATRP